MQTLPRVFEPFVYRDLDERCYVQERANRIRRHLCVSAEEIRQIGLELIEIREKLKMRGRIGYGRFLDWLRDEWKLWSERQAYRFIHIGEAFGLAQLGNSTISVRVLAELAAPSVPEEARTEALARDAAGETITHRRAKEIVQHAQAKTLSEAVDELPPLERAEVRQILERRQYAEWVERLETALERARDVADEQREGSAIYLALNALLGRDMDRLRDRAEREAA